MSLKSDWNRWGIVKKYLFVCGVGVVLFFALAFVSSLTSPRSASAEAAIAAYNNAEHGADANGNLTEDGIRHVANVKGLVSITGDKSEGYDVMITTPAPKDDIWSNTNFIDGSCRDDTKTFEKLFKEIPSIKDITLVQLLNFNDEYGTKHTLPAMKVEMSRTTANKITDWKNFGDLVFIDSNKLFRVADFHYVAPPLLK